MGETYENTYSQQILGFDVSAKAQSEHIINHPPTTLFSIKCIVDKQPLLTISGAATLEAGIWLNRSDVTRGGQTVITFARGYPKRFTFSVPSLRVYGLFVGQRWGHYLGKAFLSYSMLERSPEAEKGELQKGPTPKDLIDQKFLLENTCELEFAKSSLFKSLPKDAVFGSFGKNAGTLKGRWMQIITLDDVPVYKYAEDDSVPVRAGVAEHIGIFSDARRRPDVIAFCAGDIDTANEHKLKLEQRQRDARKLRGCE